MSLPISTLAICALAILLIILTFRVIGERSGDNETKLQRRIRGHANLTEYAPIGIALILVAELQSANVTVLGIAALAFVIGRYMHGLTFGFTDHFVPGRFTGMILTLIGLIALIALNLWTLISGG